jgi:kanamycin kinase
MSNIVQEDINTIERPVDFRVDTDKILEALQKRGCLETDIAFLMKLISNQEVYDVSGYSGSTTIITKALKAGTQEYCIKICDNPGKLKGEADIWRIMAKNNMTSQFVKYISTNKDYLITNRISSPMALSKYPDLVELSRFMGRTLRKFHNISWKEECLEDYEIKFFEERTTHMYETAISKEEGLRFVADDIGNKDYALMREYLRKHRDICKFDEVLIHGDYNARNVFAIGPDTVWFVDLADMCFGDRHYDIFFAIWTLQFYFGINKDILKARECEKMFIDAYGWDVFDINRYKYCQYLACMYWDEHNDIVHIV